MPEYFVSPSGRPDAAGTQADPWPFARLLTHQPEPGTTVRFRAGATFLGALEWFGPTDPDRPLSLTRYGDPGLPNPVIASGARRGLWCAGSGIVVEDVDFVGESGEAGIEIGSDLAGAPSRNISLIGVRATGYVMGGIVFNASAIIENILIQRCKLNGNANGLFMSGAGVKDVGGVLTMTGTNMLRKVIVMDCVADDNTLFNSASCGNGMSLAGVYELKVFGNRAFGNGNANGTTGSGITVQQCRDFHVTFNHTGGTPQGPQGDGQGIVANSSERGVIECNVSDRDHIGIDIHDDRELFEPHYVSRRIIVRSNIIRGCTVGLQLYRSRGDVWFLDNDVELHAGPGEYKKCLDIDSPDGPIYYQGNTILATADEGAMAALLIEAAGDRGLEGVWFGEDNRWHSSDARPYKVRAEYLVTLAEALAVVPVPIPAV